MKVIRSGKGLEYFEAAYIREFDMGIEDLALGIAGSLQDIAPVDTGNYRASITVERIGSLMVIIYSDVEYAVFLEFGTIYMEAQPTFRPGYEQNRVAAVEHLRVRLARVA